MAARVWSLPALMLLFCGGLAHAADQVVTNTNDSGAGSLRLAIHDVGEGDTITFALGSEPAMITLSAGELSISKSLTIAGPGADHLTVSGGNACRVFSIVSGDVTISGLTVAHGRVFGQSPEGGAIRNSGNLVLQQLTVRDSRVESNGGAGFEDAFGGGLYNEGTCEVDHCTITNNAAQGGLMTASYGGKGGGGGIYNTGTLTVKQSNVSRNLAQGGPTNARYGGYAQGGGLANAATGTLTIEDSAFSENQALGGTASDHYGGTGQGGGVYNEGTATVIGTDIVNNTAQGGIAYQYGGDGQGGGICNSNSGSLSLSGGSVQANLARGAAATNQYFGSAEGGGIHSRGSLTVTHGAITGNTAEGAKGAVAGDATAGGLFGLGILHIEDSTVCDNKALGGEGAYWTYGKLGGDADAGGLFSLATGASIHTILRTDICNNLALGGKGDSAGDATAGGIFAFKHLTIDQSSVYGNIARGGPSPGNGRGGRADGGGIHGLGNLIVKDSSIYGNTAEGGAGTGGYSDGGSGSGGGMCHGYDGDFTVRGSAVYGNTARGGDSVNTDGGNGFGGGYADSSSSYSPTATFVNATFHDNHALRGTGKTTSGKGRGGGLSAGFAATGLSFCTVTGNTADDQGGGLLSVTTDNDRGPVVKNTIIADNSAIAGPDIFANVQSRGYNLIKSTLGGMLDSAGGGNSSAGNLIGLDPRLGPFQDNGGPAWTRSLLDGSPAINAGISTDIKGTVVSVDQRGYPRPSPPGGKHDIGAFEITIKSAPSLADVVTILQVVCGSEKPASFVQHDVDGDGKIEIADAIHLLQCLAGIRACQ